MNARTYASLTAIAIAAASLAQGQTQPTTTPDAASSQHQREVTQSKTGEAPASTGTQPSAASSPHQHDAMRTGTAAEAPTPANFVKQAAQDGMTEVELGKVALDNSQDPNVRNFAERMVRDHGKANTELAAIATRKNLTVPKQLDSQHRAMVKEMSAKSGARFDMAYAQHMAADHSKAVALFEGASQSSDAELSGFAKKTLPTLKEHKRMADGLQAGRRSAEAAGAARKQ